LPSGAFFLGAKMKELRDIILIIFVCLVPISCFVSSAFLAYHNKEGWGWLIFAGLLIMSGISFKFD
jgi:hypothetical protein